MPYLLDGDNLVGAARRRPGSGEDREALVREVSDRLRRTRARVLLFFDGAGQPLTLGGLSVRYAGRESADDAIAREVARARQPGEAIIVTADRGLASRSREAGARVLSPEEFWSRFDAAARGATPRPEETPRVDVDDWERWFADRGNRKV